MPAGKAHAVYISRRNEARKEVASSVVATHGDKMKILTQLLRRWEANWSHLNASHDIQVFAQFAQLDPAAWRFTVAASGGHTWRKYT